MNVLFHPKTEKLITSISQKLPQSLLLTGESGVGLEAAARFVAKSTIATEIHPLDAKDQPSAESGLISVEMIRRLYEQTRSKQTKARVILIHNADRMSGGAQAAFLKLLEEPNAHTHFILTSHHPQKLLPTIHSRVEHCTVLPLTKSQTMEFIKALGVTDEKKQTQLLFIAEGLPEELQRLVANEEYFARRAKVVSDARDFIQSSPYEKLALIQKYKSDREQSIGLIDSALHILRRSLIARPQPSIIAQLDLLLQIRENLLANFNISLQLARFAL